MLQQVTLDNNKKYFIFGIKFDDIYIPDNIIVDKKLKIFVIEKTYLFISNEPLCKLFEKIFYFIISYKKMNFCNNLVDFNSLRNKDILSKFNNINQENVSNIFNINF